MRLENLVAVILSDKVGGAVIVGVTGYLIALDGPSDFPGEAFDHFARPRTVAPTPFDLVADSKLVHDFSSGAQRIDQFVLGHL